MGILSSANNQSPWRHFLVKLLFCFASNRKIAYLQNCPRLCGPLQNKRKKKQIGKNENENEKIEKKQNESNETNERIIFVKQDEITFEK